MYVCITPEKVNIYICIRIRVKVYIYTCTYNLFININAVYPFRAVKFTLALPIFFNRFVKQYSYLSCVQKGW